MATPQSNKDRKKRFRWSLIGTGVGLFYLMLHIPKCWDGTPESISTIMEHCLTQPFDVFPIEKDTWSMIFVVIPIVLLIMYQQYLEKRALRPGEESGSACWNEDIKKYYRKYADAKAKFSIPKPEKKNAITKIIHNLLRDIENLLFSWTLTPNENTGGKKAWTITKDEKGKIVSVQHNGTDNMIISDDVVLSMNDRKTRRNNNILVIGGSGTGKSRFMIKPNMLQTNSSYVITDPSGELLADLGTFLQECSYEIKVFNLVDFKHSNCYNPFNYIRNEEGVLSMINALIRNTTPKGSHPSDPFWEKAETALLQAICFYLIAECNPEDQNFTSVMKLLRCARAEEGRENEDSVLDVLFNKLEKKDPEHIACLSYKVFKSAGGGKTAQSILISCQTRLQTFNLKSIHKLTGTDDIDLKSIGDKPTALFCITPDEDPTFNYLVALLYTQLFETLYFHAKTECKGLRLPVPVRFLLDEFANVGTIPDFDKKLSTIRKHNISCTIVIQALSQLKSMYKDEWEILIGNCDTRLFLGGTDDTTLKYLSENLGRQTVRAKNTSRTYGRQGSSNTSYNTTGRELMTRDELSIMDNENCIVFIRGIRPFFSTKYNYERHPNYQYTGDKDESRKFNVRTKIHTGEKKSPVEEKKATNRNVLVQQAEKSDTSYYDAEEARQQFLRRREQDRRRMNRDILQKEEEEKKKQQELMDYYKDAPANSVSEPVVKADESMFYDENFIKNEQERYVVSEISPEFYIEDYVDSEEVDSES